MQEMLLSQLLKPPGYVCGRSANGIWAAPRTFIRPSAGFDEFFGFLDGASAITMLRSLRDETPLMEPEYLTDAFTREGVSFINRYATERFFLLPHTTPCMHHLTAALSLYGSGCKHHRSGSANLRGDDVALDDGVGQVLQTLQANNLLDKTLIFFLSDNGAPAKPFTSNYPLRGYKFMC